MVLALLCLWLASAAVGPAAVANADAEPVAVAHEARQVIAVIDAFYAGHHACPQPSRPGELSELQAALGDGYSVEPQGQFVAIRGISMAESWLYYTSPAHADTCTLWRKLGWDPALIWRRHRYGEKWTLDPGDGRPEKPLTVVP